jgi:hypothetical protein
MRPVVQVSTMTATALEWVESLIVATESDMGFSPKKIGPGITALDNIWFAFEEIEVAMRFSVYLSTIGLEHVYQRGTRVVCVKVPPPATREQLRPSSFPPPPNSRSRITIRPSKK